MTLRHLLAIAALALVATGCSTLDPKPFANATDCFYPACTIDVDVVDDGAGGKKLKAADDGNVRMGTRHRLVGIVWKLRTPGYEFRGDSVQPSRTRAAGVAPGLPAGSWSQEIRAHPYWFDTVSVTNINEGRSLLAYELTVYPIAGTPGKPVTLQAAIVNDPCPYPGTWCR
ncbi:MAG: hypothetical protein U1F58_12690 [Burkholderiales bacterium]